MNDWLQVTYEDDGTVTLIMSEGSSSYIISLDKKKRYELLHTLINEEIKDI